MSLFGITTFTFAMGIIALVLSTTLEIQQADTDSSTSCTTCNYIFYIMSIATFLMVRLYDSFLVVRLTQLMGVQPIICDSICAWRTVIIWNKDKRVIAILVFCILVSAGT
jgi:hypothetical protein